MSAPPPAAGPVPAPAAPKAATSKATTKKKVSATKAGATQAKAKKPTVRKRKPTTKTSSAASAQSIMAEAKNASVALAQQRALQAAKRSDPLWYKIEDIFPAIQGPDMPNVKSSVLPEQVQVVEAALAHHGLTRIDVTPQAMACLLEQARRFTQELITDAQDHAYMAGRSEITKPDLSLAMELRPDNRIAVATQLPKLNLVAQQVNKVPLPAIPSHCYNGVVLPPKEHQLTARTFDIVTSAQSLQRMNTAVPLAPGRQATPYGASRRAHQIPINLKETTKASGMASAPGSGTAPGSAPPQASHQVPDPMKIG